MLLTHIKCYGLMESRTLCRTDVVVLVKWVQHRQGRIPDDKKTTIWLLQKLIHNMERSYLNSQMTVGCSDYCRKCVTVVLIKDLNIKKVWVKRQKITAHGKKKWGENHFHHTSRHNCYNFKKGRDSQCDLGLLVWSRNEKTKSSLW